MKFWIKYGRNLSDASQAKGSWLALDAVLPAHMGSRLIICEDIGISLQQSWKYQESQNICDIIHHDSLVAGGDSY
jgi:hypothetical protein